MDGVSPLMERSAGRTEMGNGPFFERVAQGSFSKKNKVVNGHEAMQNIFVVDVPIGIFLGDTLLFIALQIYSYVAQIYQFIFIVASDKTFACYTFYQF